MIKQGIDTEVVETRMELREFNGRRRFYLSRMNKWKSKRLREKQQQEESKGREGAEEGSACSKSEGLVRPERSQIFRVPQERNERKRKVMFSKSIKLTNEETKKRRMISTTLPARAPAKRKGDPLKQGPSRKWGRVEEPEKSSPHRKGDSRPGPSNLGLTGSFLVLRSRQIFREPTVPWRSSPSSKNDQDYNTADFNRTAFPTSHCKPSAQGSRPRASRGEKEPFNNLYSMGSILGSKKRRMISTTLPARAPAKRKGDPLKQGPSRKWGRVEEPEKSSPHRKGDSRPGPSNLGLTGSFLVLRSRQIFREPTVPWRSSPSSKNDQDYNTADFNRTAFPTSHCKPSAQGSRPRASRGEKEPFNNLYSMGSILGSGGYGWVLEGHRKSDGLPLLAVVLPVMVKRGESVRPQPKRGESVRPQPKRGESVRPQPKRGESVRPQPKRGESVRPQPKRGESVRPQPKRGELVRPQPKRGELVRPQPKRGELVRPQPKRGELVRPQPKRGELVRPQPKRGELVRPQPKRGELVRPQPKRGESVCPQPKRGKAEHLQPTSSPAEGEYLFVPSMWEDCLPLPPPPAEEEYLLVPLPQWEDYLPLPAPTLGGKGRNPCRLRHHPSERSRSCLSLHDRMD
ncbi:UNVERIFIED_CONTAM: hypothetical protein FKN15_025385 [Acipenser sinensis]